jgi:hypothetical protein
MKGGQLEEIECCDKEQAITEYNRILQQWANYSLFVI